MLWRIIAAIAVLGLIACVVYCLGKVSGWVLAMFEDLFGKK